MAAIISLASYEADEFGDAFLDGLFGVVGDLGVEGEDAPHDPRQVCYGHVLLHRQLLRRSRAALDWGGRAGPRSRIQS